MRYAEREIHVLHLDVEAESVAAVIKVVSILVGTPSRCIDN